MPRARDLLERFRPIGTPGAAAPPGVPADRVADRNRELQPVFDRLVDVDAECTRIRERAAAEAARRRDAAAAEATGMVAAANREAPGNRADACARVRRQGAHELEAVVQQGERDAAALTTRSQQRMDDYVQRVVATVRRSLSGEAVEERVP